MKKFKNVVVFIVADFIFSQAFAGQGANEIFERLNNSFAVGIAGLNINYKEIFDPQETEKGFLKSTEAGTIIGVTLDKRTAFFRKIYTDLYFDIYNGKLEYDGATQIPVLTADKDIEFVRSPFKASYKHMFLNANAKAGYIFTAADNFSLQLIPYVGVGYRYWHRSGSEDYQHGKTIFGVKLDWLLTDNFVLSPYIEGGRTFNARMKIINNDSLTARFVDNSSSYSLGNKPIYSAGLELNYELSYKFFLTGFVDFTHFEYGRSNPEVIEIILKKENISRQGIRNEPDSKTNEVRVGLGIRFG